MVWRVLTCLALVSACSSAQDQEPKPARPFIRTSGEATISAKPDQATVNIGVVTQGQTAQAAAAQNAKQLDAVVNEIRKAFGSAAELKTIGYSVNPNYRYPKQGGQPEISDYIATDVLQVRMTDIAQAGKLVDLAAQSGANTIQSLQYRLKEESALHGQALREAAVIARAKAEAIAGALGLKVERVLSVEEGSSNVIRPFRAMGLAAKVETATPTPLESGSVEVHANVTLTVEIAQ